MIRINSFAFNNTGKINWLLLQWFIDMLVSWSNNDPVSQKEIDRNNNIYYNTPQGNRNPFIDHPEYICMIWTSSYCSTTSTPDMVNTQTKQIIIYPNPAIDNVSCSVYSEENTESTIEIINYLGQNIFTQNIELQNGENKFNFDISMYQQGIYYLILRNKNNEIEGSKPLVIQPL
ncbi:MAG TPA: endonuclease [Bacteroidales bacterium]|nr:endonuclease [Bacteroidales bacterium]HPS17497.1 endonuclease [Bacteroidales bacterium]